MTDYKLYPNLPSAPPENPQVAYHLSVIQAKMQGLKNKEQMFKQKYEKYTKILNRLTWLNACSSGISIATGISSVATFATFVGLPVSMALGAASMTGAIASGIISTLTTQVQHGMGPLINMQKSVFLASWDNYELYGCKILHIKTISAIESENLDRIAKFFV